MLAVCVVMAGLIGAPFTQRATGVQPHLAPESNQTGPGEAASTSHRRHTFPHIGVYVSIYVYVYRCMYMCIYLLI